MIITFLLQVNKEKGQALVEFLTPEDASTALHFDGRSFSGNILKIRRPKDYVEATVRLITNVHFWFIYVIKLSIIYMTIYKSNNDKLVVL